MRLDRYLSQLTAASNQRIRLALCAGQIRVDGQQVFQPSWPVNKFSTIHWGQDCLQSNTARYLMLNKPAGYLSANSDASQPTVFDLLPPSWRQTLHIVGRLDVQSTGLLLLTNDGQWSKKLTIAANKVVKRYHIQLAKPLVGEAAEQAIKAFQAGIYFATENVHTLPAKLELHSPYAVSVSLIEGRYRQIRRMFGSLNNQVVELKRTSIGGLVLPKALAEAEYRALTAEELALIK